MRFSYILLAATSVSAWTFSSSNSYKSWDNNQLTHWLDDHNVPYPSSSTNKDLQNLVAEKWDSLKDSTPYEEWDSKRLSTWLKGKELHSKGSVEELKYNVYNAWYHDHSTSAKEWIYDSWTDSQLKSFLDHWGITHPEPTTRGKLLTAARQGTDTISQKAGEVNTWIYDTWSDSELKKWADQRGIPVPQGSTRNDVLAIVRRNSYNANQKAKHLAENFSDSLFDTYSDSQLKKLADEHGISVPQGSRRNELVALLRRNSHQLQNELASLQYEAEKKTASLGSVVGSATSKGAKSVTSAFGAATSAAGNKWYETSDSAFDVWSDSRLKQFLDQRGVPVPQHGKKDDLVALARLYSTKAQNKVTGNGPVDFDSWSSDQVADYLEAQGHKISKKEREHRAALISNAEKQYASASSAGGSVYASATSALAKQTGYLFDSWSDSDLKAFLDSYGIPVPQGSKRNELIAAARRNQLWFTKGRDPYGSGLLSHIQNVFWENVEAVKGKFVHGSQYAEAHASTNSAYLQSKASSASSAASSAASSLHSEL